MKCTWQVGGSEDDCSLEWHQRAWAGLADLLVARRHLGVVWHDRRCYGHSHLDLVSQSADSPQVVIDLGLLMRLDRHGAGQPGRRAKRSQLVSLVDFFFVSEILYYFLPRGVGG